MIITLSAIVIVFNIKAAIADWYSSDTQTHKRNNKRNNRRY